MVTNCGTADRIVRVIVGLVLLSLVFVLGGNVRWLGLIGFIPLITGLVGNCPLYKVFGFTTCPAPKK